MKKNKSKIISLFSLSLLAFLQTACGSGCDDGLDVDAIALDDKYIINYSREVNEGRIDPSIKAYALTKRGVIDSSKPFDNDFNTMDEITSDLTRLQAAYDAAGNPLITNLLANLRNNGTFFPNIKELFADADNSSDNATKLQGQVKTLVQERYTVGSHLKNFLDTACLATLSQELQQKCQSTKAILSELLETLYGKSSLLTLELYQQQFKDKINELNKEMEDLKNIIDFAAQDNDQKNAVKNWSNLKVGAKLLSEYGIEISRSSLAHTSLGQYTNETQSKLAILKAAIPILPANPLNSTTAGKIANIENNLSKMATWLAKFEAAEESIKGTAGLNPDVIAFVKKVFLKAPALVLAKNVEIDGDTDVENVKKFFEGSSKKKLFIKDDDASSTNLSLALAAAIHNDQRSNLGDVYAFNVSNIKNAARDYGIELNDDVEKFVISIVTRSSGELATKAEKSGSNIIFVIKIDEFSGIDTKKVIEALENNSNILIFASNSAQEALGSALGTSISSYDLAGLSAPEAFIAAQAKAQSLNAARAVKLSPVAVNIIADTVAKLLAGLGTKKVTLKAVSDAVSNVFSSLSGANPNDEAVKQKVIIALGFNTAEVNNSGVLTADLKAVQTQGAPYFQAQAKKSSNNLIYKAAKIEQGKIFVAAVEELKQIKKDQVESQAEVAELDAEWADYKKAVDDQLDALDFEDAVKAYKLEVSDASEKALNVLMSMGKMLKNGLCYENNAVVLPVGDLGLAKKLIKQSDKKSYLTISNKSEISLSALSEFQKKYFSLNCSLSDGDSSVLAAIGKALQSKIESINNMVDSIKVTDKSINDFMNTDISLTTILVNRTKKAISEIEAISRPVVNIEPIYTNYNRRIWAWFLSQVVEKITAGVPDFNELYMSPTGDAEFFGANAYLARVTAATEALKQKAKVYLAAQYGLKIVGEYYNMLKALKDKNTVAEIGVEEAKGGALVHLFTNMRGVIRNTVDVTYLTATPPLEWGGMIAKDALLAYYNVLNNDGSGDIISAGFCNDAGVATVKDVANLATLKTLKIDGDVAKSTVEICKYSKLLQKTYK